MFSNLFSRLDAAIQCAFGKHMGMAPHQFLFQIHKHIIKLKAAFFLCHLTVKHNLEHQIAQLLTQVLIVFAKNGVRHLVGFFNGKRGDALVGLLKIPWAAVFRLTQARHKVAHPLQWRGGIQINVETAHHYAPDASAAPRLHWIVD